jgi:probable phosphomutase (TIGR03848 family)
MPLFLLIRHGETNYVKKGRLSGQQPGIHLNRRGKAQAKMLVEKLAGAPIKAIYSSPLERAQETASPLASALGLEVILCPNLIDTDVGEWTDRTIKSLKRERAWRTVQTAPSLLRFPGGETFGEAQHRICQEIENLAAAHDPKDMIACFSHADPIKLAVAYFIGLPLDLFQRLSISPASISALMIGETGSQLMTLNYDISLTLAKS